MNIIFLAHTKNMDSCEFIANVVASKGHKVECYSSKEEMTIKYSYYERTPHLAVRVCCSLDAPQCSLPGLQTVSVWSSREQRPDDWEGFRSVLELCEFIATVEGAITCD